MKIKVFDECHEKDLEIAINRFLIENQNIKIIDIKYSTSHFSCEEVREIYSFSALLMYEIDRC